MKGDFSLQYHGSISILYPYTDAAKDWIDQNLGDDIIKWGNGIVIEHPYVDNIVLGIIADGLSFGGQIS